MKNLNKVDDTLISLHKGRNFLYDARYPADGTPKPVIIFIHGFKGFKDWGHFNLIADYFGEKGYVFIKLNLSHNGTTPEQPIDFADLEAFGKNNFSIELDDIGVLIDHIFSGECKIPAKEMDFKKLYLIGHSRGGGIALLKANEDQRVKAVATLAAIHDLDQRWGSEVLQKWKEEEVQYIYNSRTKQDMPLYYQLVEDLEKNHERLDIPKAVKEIQQPLLIVHGTADETLPVDMAREIKSWNQHAELMIVEGGQHTFGGYHPYDKDELPEHTRKVVEQIDAFFRDVRH